MKNMAQKRVQNWYQNYDKFKKNYEIKNGFKMVSKWLQNGFKK
jgi:ribosomal protein L7Ae-like RNA K-turn-binding protein